LLGLWLLEVLLIFVIVYGWFPELMSSFDAHGFPGVLLVWLID
jgi:hypothetical protein